VHTLAYTRADAHVIAHRIHYTTLCHARHIQTSTPLHTRKYMHIHMHIRSRLQIYIYPYTCTYTCTYKYIYTYIYIYI
jgi:hypothetical protein